MNLNGVTYTGPELGTPELLERLPVGLRSLLEQTNGFILFDGALHVRGACDCPTSHSLSAAWCGEAAFHRLYPAVQAHWIPFAEDCVGDQFFIVDGTIRRLEAETGEVHETKMTLRQFLEAVEADPMKTLQAEPLLQFREENGDLPQGHLILAYPPFCTEEARDGVSLAAIAAPEVHSFHANFARQLPSVGSKIFVKVVE